MDTERLHVRSHLSDALDSLVDDALDVLGKEDVIDLLEEALKELQGTEQLADVSFASDAGEPALTLTYHTGDSLEADLDQFMEVQGLTLNLDSKPPLMEAFDIIIKGDDTAGEVVFEGRAIHATDEEVVIEILDVGGDDATRLREFADAIRAEPSASTEPSEPQPQRLDEASTSVAKKAPKPKPETDSEPADNADSSVPIVDRLIEPDGEPLRSWDLEELEPEEILLEVATTEGYKVLQLELDDQTRQYVVHDGKVVDDRLDPPVDAEQQLIERMVDDGYITSEQLERADALANIHDMSCQDALVDIGSITVEQLLEIIRLRLVDEIEVIWEAASGQMALYSLSKRPALRLRRATVDLLPVIVDRVRHRFEELHPSELDELRSSFSGHRIQKRQPLPFDIARLELDRSGRRFLDVLLDEPRTLADLKRMSNLWGERLIRQLLVFDELNLLERCGTAKKSPDHDRIDGLAKSLEGKNHFEVLEIHWSAYPEEVEQAYEKVRERLEVSEEVRESKSEKLEELRRCISRARSTLIDDNSRRRYRNKQVDDFAQRSALEVYERKAETYEMRRDIEKLIDCLARIVELNPDADEARQKLEALRQKH